MSPSDRATMLALHMDKGYKSEKLETSGGGTEKERVSALGPPRRSAVLPAATPDPRSEQQ